MQSLRYPGGNADIIPLHCMNNKKGTRDYTSKHAGFFYTDPRVRGPRVRSGYIWGNLELTWSFGFLLLGWINGKEEK